MPPLLPSNTHNRSTSRTLSAVGVLCLLTTLLVGGTADQSVHATQDAVGTEPVQEEAERSNEVVECVVTFLTGRKLTGILTASDEESIVLRINGIDTTYRRARISSVRFLDPIDQRYREFRDSIPDDDIDGRLMLVDWLRDRRAYSLAIEELDSILELEPHNQQAKLLKTWLVQHLKLSKNRDSKNTKPKQTRAPVNKAPIPLLDKEEVNLIRVFEIDLANPPDLVIEDSTIRKLITRAPTMFPTDEKERAAILKWPQIEKLKLLFRHRARDLYPEIRVLEDPTSMKAFQKQIAGHNGWLINGCATARCHGGDQAGELKLSNYNPNSPETLYTNFLILDRFKLKDGTPIINHSEAERSPLLHMGLVRSRSLYPHPAVDAQKIGRDWRAVFRTTTSINFKRTADWIRTLFTPRPDYGIEYPSSPDTPQEP